MMRDVVHETDAARAQDAAVRDIDDVAAEVLDGIESLRLTITSFGPSFLIRVVLQLALARLIADWTIERMIDEQHLEHALPRFERLVGVHAHDLAFRDGRRARRRELRRLLDFDETHAAYAGDGKAGVIAVVRDEHARRLRRLEDRRPRRHRHRTPFDR